MAAHDIIAGHKITAADLTTRTQPAGLAPEGHLDKDAIVGKIAAHGLTTGDTFSPLNVLGEDLTNTFVTINTINDRSEPGNMVPLPLADPALAPLLQHGDVVSVVVADENTSEPRVISAGGTIISTTESTAGKNATAVLIALPESDARKVAAISMYTPVAVVVTGARAHNDP
ncbi:SAF domain-containing protein [Corynebacterium aquilae]|uniref:SAF domain-containing protein n=1 Tax=Corynebacterium aquilae TaxID=203263 RepID=UPI001474E734|nr:SAF domain-containing protein [Corynebacterium aquilae]